MSFVSQHRHIFIPKIFQRTDTIFLPSMIKIRRLVNINDNFESHLNSEIKVIVNSPEWEITLHLHEFDESWMRYALGRGSDTEIIRL